MAGFDLLQKEVGGELTAEATLRKITFARRTTLFSKPTLGKQLEFLKPNWKAEDTGLNCYPNPVTIRLFFEKLLSYFKYTMIF